MGGLHELHHLVMTSPPNSTGLSNRTPVPSGRASAALLPLLLLFATLPFAACRQGGTGPEEAALDRETFVTVYVELRVAAIQEGAESLTDAARQEVLDRFQVTEEDLMEFAEVHGGEVGFMRGIWDEVEARLDARREDPPADGTR